MRRSKLHASGSTKLIFFFFVLVLLFVLVVVGIVIIIIIVLDLLDFVDLGVALGAAEREHAKDGRAVVQIAR